MYLPSDHLFPYPLGVLMSVMRKAAYTTAAPLGAAAVAFVPVAGASAAPHSRPQVSGPYWEYATGYGSTLSAAKVDAEGILASDCIYGTNSVPTTDNFGQEANGTWWAAMQSYCSPE
jgi:hypothetical protein